MLQNHLMGKKKNFKRILVCFLSMVLVFTSLYCNNLYTNAETKTEYTIELNDNSSGSLDTSATDNISDGAILQAFCWSFNTIKNNMADIAAAGYTSIQTSPINAVNSTYSTMKLMGNDTSGGTDGAWWWHYQPTDWTIGNYQVGTRDEFKAMCAEADKYNIKIIVDVVPNHTTSDTSKVSSNLTNACTSGSLYHDTGFTAISDWSNRYQCTRYEMGRLPDVNTEDSGFQDYFISYLNDCIACGADGFRYDTAKHIGLPDDDRPSGVTNNFWTRVTSEITNADSIFNYGEVLQGSNERLAAYADVIGSTTTSDYGAKIRSAITSNNLSTSTIVGYEVASGVDISDLVTWVESHDNYINDGTWSQLDETQIKLGWAIITAREDGAPLFFSRPYGSSTSNKWGSNTIGIAGSDLYKDDEVAAVNKFRNAMVGEDEYLYNPNSNTQVLMIERGSKGAVLINTSSSATTVSNSTTRMADGTYTSITDDGATFTVSDGKISGTIPARAISVLMTGSNAGPSVSIENFKSSFTTDTTTLTLSATNTTKATYQINDDPSYLYENGDTITIGEGDDYGTTYQIELRGIDSDGNTTSKEYTITKTDPSAGTTIYFEKPSSWGSSIYAYIYDESGSSVEELASWPGTAMTKEEDGLYSLTFTESFSNPLVIFNDGSNQTPGSGETGFAVENGATYDSDGIVSMSGDTENTITVYYYTGWSTAYIHYQIGSGSWTTAPGVAMSDANVDGYKTITIDLGSESSLTACFNNGNGSWDNNSSNNYKFSSAGTYTVKDGTITSGKPN